MAAVTLKLSARDAGYLIQMLDAVAAASRDIEPRKCGACLGSDGRLDVPCKQCNKTGLVPNSVEVARAQALRNAGPFGDFKSNRTFALRIGATLLSAKNIADAHNE